MTAKRRARIRAKRRKKTENPLKSYRFFTNSREVYIPAENLNDAKHKFQEQFGYWPA